MVMTFPDDTFSEIIIRKLPALKRVIVGFVSDVSFGSGSFQVFLLILVWENHFKFWVNPGAEFLVGLSRIYFPEKYLANVGLVIFWESANNNCRFFENWPWYLVKWKFHCYLRRNLKSKMRLRLNLWWRQFLDVVDFPM